MYEPQAILAHIIHEYGFLIKLGTVLNYERATMSKLNGSVVRLIFTVAHLVPFPKLRESPHYEP